MKKIKINWDWKLFIIMLLIGFLLGKTIKSITNERCSLVAEEEYGGFFIRTSGFECNSLRNNCQDYINEGYICRISENDDARLFETDFWCYCKIQKEDIEIN